MALVDCSQWMKADAAAELVNVGGGNLLADELGGGNDDDVKV